MLFDLDGTLIDSAPTSPAPATTMRAARGSADLPLAPAMVGSGAPACLGRAAVAPDRPISKRCATYSWRSTRRMTRESRVFAAIRPVLAALDARRTALGHRHQQGDALLRAAGACAPGLLDQAQPHADLRRHRRIRATPFRRCWRPRGGWRSIRRICRLCRRRPARRAGRPRHGMLTVAAAWGYLGEGEPSRTWDARHVVRSPGELLKLLALPKLTRFGG